MTDFNPGYLLNSLVYSGVGLAMFAVAFAVVRRALPFDLWKEVRDNGNTAVATVVAAILLGAAIIIASTVH